MLTLTSPRMSISAPASAQQNSICNFGQKSVFRKMMLKSEMRQSRAAELMLHWSQWPVAVMCQCPDGITGYSPRRALHRQQALTTICEKMSNSDLKTETSPNGLEVANQDQTSPKGSQVATRVDDKDLVLELQKICAVYSRIIQLSFTTYYIEGWDLYTHSSPEY